VQLYDVESTSHSMPPTTRRTASASRWDALVARLHPDALPLRSSPLLLEQLDGEGVQLLIQRVGSHDEPSF